MAHVGVSSRSSHPTTHRLAAQFARDVLLSGAHFKSDIVLEAVLGAIIAVPAPDRIVVEALDVLVSTAEGDEDSVDGLGEGAELLAAAHLALASAISSGYDQARNSARRAADTFLLETHAFAAGSSDYR